MMIRAADYRDSERIGKLHRDAFGDPEGAAVAQLAQDLLIDETARPVLAWVAERDGELIGSVIFSTVRIAGCDNLAAFILAPLAVAAPFQGQGAGRELAEYGLAALRARGADAVFVLGDPKYYGRFRFTHKHQVTAPHAPPFPEAWMALALRDGALVGVSGRLSCARCLEAPEHW